MWLLEIWTPYPENTPDRPEANMWIPNPAWYTDEEEAFAAFNAVDVTGGVIARLSEMVPAFSLHQPPTPKHWGYDLGEILMRFEDKES